MLQYGIRSSLVTGMLQHWVSEQFGNGLHVTLWGIRAMLHWGCYKMYQSYGFNTEPAWVEFLLKEKFGLVSGRIWNYSVAMVHIK
jgi:hypothetical protein